MWCIDTNTPRAAQIAARPSSAGRVALRKLAGMMRFMRVRTSASATASIAPWFTTSW